MKKKIVVISESIFPSGDANSIRYENIGLLLQRKGYEMFYVGVGNTPYKERMATEFGTVISIKKHRSHNILSKALNHIGLYKRLVSYAKKVFPDAAAIIVSGDFAPSQLNTLSKFYSMRGAKVILSITEEYTKFEFEDANPYLRDKMVKNNAYYVNKFTSRDVSILTISSYLENKFKSRNLKAATIPFVFDKEYKNDIKQLPHDKVRFVYCGTPGNKDDLLMMLQAFHQLDPETLKKVRFDVAGADENWFRIKDIWNDMHPKIKDAVFLHGRQPRDEITKLYSMADFSILVRDPNQVFSKAGFPTKVSESLYFGVPVLSNLTSDLDKFLNDGVNSLVIPEYSIESVKKTIKKAVSLGKETLENMKVEAKKTSKEKLCTDAYWAELKSLIED